LPEFLRGKFRQKNLVLQVTDKKFQMNNRLLFNKMPRSGCPPQADSFAGDRQLIYKIRSVIPLIAGPLNGK
jgi:hypothetical protein